jgi:hypothetical protein
MYISKPNQTLGYGFLNLYKIYCFAYGSLFFVFAISGDRVAIFISLAGTVTIDGDS